MDYTAESIIKIAIAIVFAIVMGNGSVVCFNRMPAKWFEDYDESTPLGEDPPKVMPKALIEADNEGRQRIASSPWKYAFVGYFAISGLYLALRGGSIAYEIAVLCVMFVTLEMAIADQLYQVVPDQFMWVLAAIAIGFMDYFDKWWKQPLGALIGLGICIAIMILGKLIFKSDSMGGADIKFFGSMGLVAGPTGIVIIFILTTLIFALYSFIKIAMGKGSIKDKNPMLPSAAAAMTIYYLFLWNASGYIEMQL